MLWPTSFLFFFIASSNPLDFGNTTISPSTVAFGAICSYTSVRVKHALCEPSREKAARQAGLPPVSLSGWGRHSSPDQQPPPPISMGLTTFPIMKYSQVTGSLRNDGGQSIAFQRVIFSPFRRPCLSCWQSLAQEEGWIEAQVWHLSDSSSL